MEGIGIKAELNSSFNHEVRGGLLIRFVLRVFRVFTFKVIKHKWIFAERIFEYRIN